MKSIRTMNEAKALADRAAKRLAQERARDRASAEALAKWRSPFLLTQWLMGRR